MATRNRSNRRALHNIGAQGHSAVSKYYLIGSIGSNVHIKHGRAEVIKGKIVPSTERKIVTAYNSTREAADVVRRTVEQKLQNGYEPTPPTMRPRLSVFAGKTKRKASKKRVNLNKVQKQIKQIEEFDVRFSVRSGGVVRGARSDRGGLQNYAAQFERRISGSKTFADWKKIRFYSRYPEDLIVEILDGSGNVVSDKRKLQGIRNTYTQ